MSENQLLQIEFKPETSYVHKQNQNSNSSIQALKYCQTLQLYMLYLTLQSPHIVPKYLSK